MGLREKIVLPLPTVVDLCVLRMTMMDLVLSVYSQEENVRSCSISVFYGRKYQILSYLWKKMIYLCFLWMTTIDLVLSVNSVEENSRSCPICVFLNENTNSVLSKCSVEENARSFPICVFFGRQCQILSCLCILRKKIMLILLKLRKSRIHRMAILGN